MSAACVSARARCNSSSTWRYHRWVATDEWPNRSSACWSEARTCWVAADTAVCREPCSGMRGRLGIRLTARSTSDAQLSVNQSGLHSPPRGSGTPARRTSRAYPSLDRCAGNPPSGGPAAAGPRAARDGGRAGRRPSRYRGRRVESLPATWCPCAWLSRRPGRGSRTTPTLRHQGRSRATSLRLVRRGERQSPAQRATRHTGGARAPHSGRGMRRFERGTKIRRSGCVRAVV